tara:strand:+ start:390 stop:566 length:177 start_codon:yes stop_codon:yes gene_type:complete
MSKFKAEVKVVNDPKWYGNDKVFDTKSEAEEYAGDLFQRWTTTTDWRVVEINNLNQEG